jgi:hypothetical protein
MMLVGPFGCHGDGRGRSRPRDHMRILLIAQPRKHLRGSAAAPLAEYSLSRTDQMPGMMQCTQRILLRTPGPTVLRSWSPVQLRFSCVEFAAHPLPSYDRRPNIVLRGAHRAALGCRWLLDSQRLERGNWLGPTRTVRAPRLQLLITLPRMRLALAPVIPWALVSGALSKHFPTFS